MTKIQFIAGVLAYLCMSCGGYRSLFEVQSGSARARQFDCSALDIDFTIDGSTGENLNRVVRDAEDNIYLTARTTAGANWLVPLRKYDCNGIMAWEQMLYTAPNKTGNYGLVFDKQKNILTAGGNYTQAQIRKFDRAGTEVTGGGYPIVKDRGGFWEGFGGGYMNALLIDEQENLYGLQYYYGGDAFTRWAAYKFNSAGVEQWMVEFASAPSGPLGMARHPLNGDIFILATENGTMRIRRYDGAGNENLTGWPIAHSDDSGNTLEQSMAFSPDGSTFFTNGMYLSGGKQRWQIRHFSLWGSEIFSGWPRQFDYLTASNEYGISIVVNTSGEIYALGQVNLTGQYQIIIRKFEPNGTEITAGWPITIGPINSASTYSESLVLDSFENVIVGFYADTRLYVRRYSANGVQN